MERQSVLIDFHKIAGKMKPMHAVNNGPAGSKVRGTGNAQAYQDAGIPYARLHDASFYSGYGGEYSVDVHRIFRNFDADENDPASYLFSVTDKYLAAINEVGTKVFYRLGASIEHGYKLGTYPPKDYAKWARICEHIIRHYTEGWADGFFYDIPYWEIWNEPDCRNPDNTNPCWQGTDEQFIEFFSVAIEHLKTCFPELKFGGPAFTSAHTEMTRPFLAALQNRKLPLDFFSFHGYESDPQKYPAKVALARKNLDDFGFLHTELCLNEWNYVKGWLNEEWQYSLRMEKGLKGASFIAATMCLLQYSKLDMLMYYDARPCGMNGMFDTNTLSPLKGYYPFKMFNELYKLETCVEARSDSDKICVCAAKNGEEQAIMLTYFDDDDRAQDREVRVGLCGLADNKLKKIKLYLLDADNNMTLVRDELTQAGDVGLYLKMKLFDTYLILIGKA